MVIRIIPPTTRYQDRKYTYIPYIFSFKHTSIHAGYMYGSIYIYVVLMDACARVLQSYKQPHTYTDINKHIDINT